VEATQSDPEKYGKLLEQMNKSGKAAGAFKKFKNMPAAVGAKAQKPNSSLKSPHVSC
jgi:hypothetical protein